jgi:hypothetical protein
MSGEKEVGTCLLLPVQYTDLIRRNTLLEGEKKLLLAVLDDAIRCYLRNVNSKVGERGRDFIEVICGSKPGGGLVTGWGN